MRIDRQTWPETYEIFKKKAAIIPIGATEQHGPHLPLGTDIFYAEYIAEKVGEALHIAVLPPLSYSISGYNFPYPTVTLEPETLTGVLRDICRSLKFFGIESIFLIVGHGGENCSAVETAAYCIARDIDVQIKVMYPWTFLPEEMRKKMDEDWHSGFLETSDMLFIKPELVKKEKIKKSSIPKPLDFIGDYKKTKRDSREGVFGNPLGATATIGEKNMGIVVEKIVKIIRALTKERS